MNFNNDLLLSHLLKLPDYLRIFIVLYLTPFVFFRMQTRNKILKFLEKYKFPGAKQVNNFINTFNSLYEY
jgi:hypothetical protein